MVKLQNTARYYLDQNLCRAGNLHHELGPGVGRPGELCRHLSCNSLVRRYPALETLYRGNVGTKEPGGIPAREGKRTDSLLDNLVKLVNQDKTLLVSQPAADEKHCKQPFLLNCSCTCTCSSCTGRESGLASCRASSAPCTGRGPPASHSSHSTGCFLDTCSLRNMKSTLRKMASLPTSRTCGQTSEGDKTRRRSKLTCAALTSALLKMGPILRRKSGKGELG